MDVGRILLCVVLLLVVFICENIHKIDGVVRTKISHTSHIGEYLEKDEKCSQLKSHFYDKGLTVCDLEHTLPSNFYGHGGFFGSAPLMFADNDWIDIFQHISPDIYMSFFMNGKNSDSSQDIGFENNPVGSAFALLKEEKVKRKDMVFEWDIFFAKDVNFNEENWGDEVLIAHGNPSQLKNEADGKNQFDEVKKLRRTALGGVTLKQWIKEFTYAVEFAENKSKRKLLRDETATFSALKEKLSNTYEKYVESGAKFRVVLDIKTGNYDGGAVPNKIDEFISALTSYGITVEGVGSFSSDQLLITSDVSKVLFFHGLYGNEILKEVGVVGKQFLEVESLENHINVIMFNFGFLIKDDFTINTELIKKIEDQKKKINSKKSNKIKIGLYTQEYSIGTKALTVMFEAIEKNKSIFEKGFAWGGSSTQWYGKMDQKKGRALQNFLANENKSAYESLEEKMKEKKDAYLEKMKDYSEKVKESLPSYESVVKYFKV